MKPPCSCLLEKGEQYEEADKLERWAYRCDGCANGVDVMVGALLSIALLVLAAADGVCQPSGDESSGADGSLCTIDKNWNESAWLAVNGSDCTKTIGLRTGYFNLPTGSCQSAMAAYRSSHGFTCNCSSDYSVLRGGVRPGLIQTIAQLCINILAAIVIPVAGAIVERGSSRKTLYLCSAVVLVIATFVCAVLGANYVWIVAMVASIVTGVAHQLMLLSRMPYLAEIATDPKDRSRLSAMNIAYTFGGQIIFMVLVVGLAQVVLKLDQGELASFASIVAAIWIAIGAIGFVHPNLGHREASSALKKTSKGTCGAAFGDLAAVYGEGAKYPLMRRYLLAHFFQNAGIRGSLAQMTTFGVVYLRFNATVLSLGILSILMFGIPGALVAKWTTKYVKPKKMHILSLLAQTACIFVISFLLRPGSVMLAIVGLMICGFINGMFFSFNYSNYTVFVPAGQEAKYAGLFNFVGFLGTIPPPIGYTAIVQSINDHRVAFIHITGYILIAVVIIASIDFEKGADDVEESLKHRQGFSERLKEAELMLSTFGTKLNMTRQGVASKAKVVPLAQGVTNGEASNASMSPSPSARRPSGSDKTKVGADGRQEQEQEQAQGVLGVKKGTVLDFSQQ